MTGETTWDWFPNFNINEDPQELGARFTITGPPNSPWRRNSRHGWQPNFYWDAPGEKIRRGDLRIKHDDEKEITEWRECIFNGDNYLAAKFEYDGQDVWTNLRTNNTWWAKVWFVGQNGWHYTFQ